MHLRARCESLPTRFLFETRFVHSRSTSTFEFAALGTTRRPRQTFKKASKIAIAKLRRGSLGTKQSKIAGSNRRRKTPVNNKKLSVREDNWGKKAVANFLVMDPVRNL